MKHYFYIIYSAQLNKYYIGHTENVEVRLVQHNSGISAYTSKAHDWICVYFEFFDNREAARNREVEVKKKKSRKYIEWLIAQKG